MRNVDPLEKVARVIVFMTVRNSQHLGHLESFKSFCIRNVSMSDASTTTGLLQCCMQHRYSTSGNGKSLDGTADNCGLKQNQTHMRQQVSATALEPAEERNGQRQTEAESQ